MASRSPQAALASAAAHLQAGRASEAYAEFEALTQVLPQEAAPARGLAEALLALGRPDLAEAPARRAATLHRRGADCQVTLAAVLVALERTAEAERALRAALASERRHPVAALRLSLLLQGQGRMVEAAQATAPLAATSNDPGVLSVHAESLKALDRRDEALALYRRWVDLAPADVIARHNLAAVLADLRRDDEALAAAEQAQALGASRPETWLVRAHALQGLGRYEEAERAYEQAIARRPAYVEAVSDLARLVWMRTGDLDLALRPFEDALVAAPADPALRLAKSRLVESSGDRLRAYEVLAVAPEPREAAVQIAAARLAAHVAPADAIVHARLALIQAPRDTIAAAALAEAYLAQAEPRAVLETLEPLLRLSPFDQHLLALQAVAWRMLADERYRSRYDYAATVQTFLIQTPAAWSSLEAYLADLALALERRHQLLAHPVGQSLRGGTQTGENLQRSSDPAIMAFFDAIRDPIHAYMTALGQGRDVLRRRNTRRYVLAGAWSVRLAPGGRHVDHIHPEGWLSSAFYVGVPPTVQAGRREGWLKFGEPGLPHGPPLSAEHYVRPEPGRLVLFPSYMWHGTVPFGGDASRLTMAFDVVPA